MAASNDRQNRYLQRVLIIVMLALFAMGLLLVRDYQRFTQTRDHEAEDYARHLRFEIELYFQRYQLLFSGISETPCFRVRSHASCNQLLRNLNRRLPEVENFAAADRDGRIFASGLPFDTEHPPSVRHLRFFNALREGEELAVMDPHTGPISGKPVTGLVISLLDDEGRFDGLLGASISLTELEGIWDEMLRGDKALAFVFDRNYRLLASSAGANRLVESGHLDVARLTHALQTQTAPVRLSGYWALRQRSSPGDWWVVVLRDANADLSDYVWTSRVNVILGSGFVLLLISLLLLSHRESKAQTRLVEAEQKLMRSERELEALTALEQSQSRYRELFETAPVALWEEDFEDALDEVRRLQAQGVGDLLRYFDAHPEKLREIAAKVRILQVNKAAIRLHKAASQAELIGGLDRIFTDRSYRTFAREIALLAEGSNFVELQDEVGTLDGETRYVVGQVYRVRSGGDRDRMLVATIDVTEQRATEQALQRSQKMEAIGKISGGIAHDFNNILGIIIGNLDMLKLRTEGDAKSIRWVESALQAALRAAELTRQLLGFSRQQAQQTEVADLNRIIDEMQNLIERSLTPAIEVRYHRHDNLWPTSINVGDCKDALLNLILNARDSIRGSGSIELELCNYHLEDEATQTRFGLDAGDYVRLRVSDTGEGIAAADTERIFEPFFTTKPLGKGTGLGLSMVFGFVRRSAGGIAVDSSPGRGTVFTLLLPRSGRATESPPRPQQTVAIPELSGKTVLVVDDEPGLLDLAAYHLQSWGLKVITAADGAEALRKLETTPELDLLFTDIVMPGGTGGYQLAERALERYPGIKVLFTSGYSNELQQGLFRLPATRLLNKPYSREELKQTIHQIFSG